MVSRGSAVLRDIETTVATGAEMAERAGRALRATADRIEKIREDERRQLADVARARFDALEAKQVTADLDVVDQRVLALLAERDAARLETEEGVAEATADRERREAVRLERRAELDAAVAALEDRRDTVTETLAASPRHEMLVQRAERAAAQAQAAHEKAEASAADRAAKGEPYEKDKLFSYLWKRGYRTERYRANALIRALDGWVAKLCRYDGARRNYARLLEIPVRLAEHAERAAAKAVAETEAVAASVADAEEQAGVPELVADVDGRALVLTKAEEAVEEAEVRIAKGRERLAAFDADDDEISRKAYGLLLAHVESEPLATLQRDAAATPTSMDDLAVSSLAALQNERAKLGTTLAQQQAEHQKALDALAQAEDVRRRFRRNDYDASNSVLKGGLDWGRLLNGVLTGLVTAAEIWATMSRNQWFETPPASRRSGSWGGGWSWSGSSRGGGGRSSGGGWSWGGGSSGGGRSSGGGWSGGGSSRSSGGSSSRGSSGGFRTGGGF